MNQLIVGNHPLYHHIDISTYEYEPFGDENICDILERVEAQIIPTQLYTLLYNGEIIHRDNWNDIIVGEDDEIILKATVGDGETSRTIGFVVIAVAAAVASTGVSTALTTAGYSAFAAGAAAAGTAAAITLGGSLILNALIPVVIPKLGQPKTDDISPIYSLTGAGNRLRPYEPLIVVFGRHKIFPDIDAFPYSRIGPDGDFYLYQTFSIGMGPVATVSNIRIGDTPISNYDNVEYELSGSDGIITLFPTNVTETLLNYELKQPDGYKSTTTTTNAIKFTWTLQGQLFAINDKTGDTVANTVSFRGQYRPVGGSWVDLNDDEGYWVDGRYFIRSESKDIIRRTFTKTVSLGQYEVRIKRETYEHTEDTKFSQWVWTDIDTQEHDSNDYTGQYRMALEVRANEVASGQLDQISMVVSSETDVWTGSAWVVQETSNPAWWYLKSARGTYDSTGRRMWGLGLNDEDIDIDNIIAWADFCDDNNLSFNYVLDSRQDAPSIMALIAKTGRATISYPNGKLGVIFDEEKSVATQKFTMSNIIADSFTISYESSQVADEIIGTFLDENTWKPDIVRVNIPGVSFPETPLEFQLYGVTNRTQAAAEINLLAASQVYHRRTFSWECAVEALACTKGDRVDLAHDLLSIESRRLIAPSTATVLRLDGDITLPSNPYIQVRAPNGTIATRAISSAGGSPNTIILASALPFNPSGDALNDEEDYIASIGSSSSPFLPVKIVSIEPLDEQAHRFRIAAREENTAYYAAASGSYNYTAPGFYNRQVPQVVNIEVQEQWLGNNGVRLYLSYELVQSIGVEIRTRITGSSAWVNHGMIYGSSFTMDIPHPLPSGLTYELIPLSLKGTRTTNTTVQYAYDIVGFVNIPNFSQRVPDVSGLQLIDSVTSNTFATRNAKFQWRAVGDTNLDGSAELGEQYGQVVGYEIRIIDTNGTIVRKDFSQTNVYTYTWENNYDDHQGDVQRRFTISVFAVGQFGQLSKKAATLTVSNPAPEATTAVIRATIDQFFADIDEPERLPDFGGYYVCADVTPGFTPSLSNVVYKGPDSLVVWDNSDNQESIYVRVGIFDSFSDDIADVNFSSDYSVRCLKLLEVVQYNTAGVIFEPERIVGSPETESVYTNWLYWTSGYAKGGGEIYQIPAGSVLYPGTGTTYIYFDPDTATGSPQTVTLQTTQHLSTAVVGTILGTYEGGGDFIGANGDAFIDGGRIIARTIGASHLVANTAVITEEIQINAATINSAHIIDAAVVNAKIGNVIQSGSYVEDGNGNPTAGWKLDKTGLIRGTAIEVWDGGIPNTMILGTTEWAEILNKPAFGIFATAGQLTSGSIGTYIANAAIVHGLIANAAIGTANIIDANINTLKVAGEAVTIIRTASAPGNHTLTTNYITYASLGIYLPYTGRVNVIVGIQTVSFDNVSTSTKTCAVKVLINGTQYHITGYPGNQYNTPAYWRDVTYATISVPDISGNVTIEVQASKSSGTTAVLNNITINAWGAMR